ncbi:UPF0728 protein C10orf53 homolog [Parus major]|uniref:UPF0728 protein C10orf53 homolog n=1 Tax=Parus major TaxID=9157 RepID=UPI001443D309|nr:UPF0728 protein C10orf53 homolog [Parus major]
MAEQQQKLKARCFMKQTLSSATSPAFSQIQYWALLLCPFPAGLKTDGHQLILEVVTGWNAVDLEVNREIVFHCNIYDLDFEGDGKLDPLCEEARKAVLNA